MRFYFKLVATAPGLIKVMYSKHHPNRLEHSLYLKYQQFKPQLYSNHLKQF